MRTVNLPVSDGLLVVVKDDCETCHLVVPVLAELAGREDGVVVVSQDQAGFPEGFEVVHDGSWTSRGVSIPRRPPPCTG